MSLYCEFRCKNCGRERMDHQAKTFNCPMSRHRFTHFDPDKVFEADPKKKTRHKRPIIL